MAVMGVVPAFDELEDRHAGLALGFEAAAVEQFAFERGEETLAHRVIEAIADGAHRGPHARLAATLAEGERSVLATLVYIRQLGAGAIWLTPVLKNCQYEKGTFHGYGIQDFLHAEPRFASTPANARPNPARSDDELRTLVDAIHARGMYVIFDIVLNHTGNVFGYVRAGQDNAPDAPFQDAVYKIRWHNEQGAAAFADFS